MNNITYSHEHMVIDLSKQKGNEDCYLNVYEEALEELIQLYNLGVRRIVDCSNHGIGVNWDINRKIEHLTGIEVINSTGFYKDPFFPDYVSFLPIDDLANIMVEDISNGAKVIGEIGTSKNEITTNEKKVFLAACQAQKKTEKVIITHTTLGTMALEQVDLFKEQNVNLRKVIISHTALANNLGLLFQLAEMGVNLAFDTIGKTNYLPDETRVTFIKELIKHNYTNQLLFSMDLTRQSHLKKNGGHGYSYLIENFVPMLLEAGVNHDDIEQIMCKNFTEIMEA